MGASKPKLQFKPSDRIDLDDSYLENLMAIYYYLEMLTLFEYANITVLRLP